MYRSIRRLLCAVALSALCIVVNAQVKDPFVHNMDDTLSTAVGDMNDYHGSVSLGLIDGRVNIQGPIIKGRTSFNLAYRCSWVWLRHSLHGAIWTAALAFAGPSTDASTWSLPGKIF